jgi:ribonuclease Z
MMKMEPPTVFVPQECLEEVRKLLAIMQRLDRGRQLAEVRGLTAGDEIELSREHLVTVFDTVHTIPSRGYVVWERRHKLKEEFVGLPGHKIKELRLSGVAITREVRIPLVAYTGDTAPAGLDACPACYEAKILITEMSFIRASHRRDKIHKFGHMHLDDFVERLERFRNELIVVAHFSTRYHPSEVRKILDQKLPSGLRERMKIWL